MKKEMNYLTYNPLDLVNGEGTRVSLFVAGCEHQCYKCFSAKSHSFTSGFEYTKELEDRIIEDLKDSLIPKRGLSILGGEPLHPRNLDAVGALIARVRNESPSSDIWLWSGYEFNEMSEEQRSVVACIDVLIDGKFEYELRDLSLKWRGSSNQNIINIKEVM